MPSLQSLVNFANASLRGPNFSVGLRLGDEWQPVTLGTIGSELPDADVDIYIGDGEIRPMYEDTQTAPRTYTMNTTGADEGDTVYIYKLSTVHPATITFAGWTMTLSAGRMWLASIGFSVASAWRPISRVTLNW